MPLVTVITAGYNASKYALKAINSVLNQTYKNIEYIYVDDGSTDDSVNMISKSIKDTRFQLINNSINTGQTNCLNIALERARGAYIAILDADDECLPSRIEKQVSQMEQNQELLVSCTGYLAYDEDDHCIASVAMDHNTAELNYLMQYNNIVAHSTVMYRQHINADICYKTNLIFAEDYELLLRFTRCGAIGAIKEPEVKYRVVTGGMTRSNLTATRTAKHCVLKEYYQTLYNINASLEQIASICECPTSIAGLAYGLKQRNKIYLNYKRNNRISCVKYLHIEINYIKNAVYAIISKRRDN